ncbi:hypothetical protein AXG93_1860s1410 [Marchantia polymorpha subsp. ruderalis]|uniref:Uncharacterized protein n=1 Tax=Marchantia polymorpha subsp. ruderalis TaxID=1480154 RepID=A0A176VG85_MARPO|nr:hypothetical protein AXG93_1860s1410 [Marchantia polymorpha subsp. ruderalis]
MRSPAPIPQGRAGQGRATLERGMQAEEEKGEVPAGPPAQHRQRRKLEARLIMQIGWHNAHPPIRRSDRLCTSFGNGANGRFAHTLAADRQREVLVLLRCGWTLWCTIAGRPRWGLGPRCIRPAEREKGVNGELGGRLFCEVPARTSTLGVPSGGSSKPASGLELLVLAGQPELVAPGCRRRSRRRRAKKSDIGNIKPVTISISISISINSIIIIINITTTSTTTTPPPPSSSAAAASSPRLFDWNARCKLARVSSVHHEAEQTRCTKG